MNKNSTKDKTTKAAQGSKSGLAPCSACDCFPAHCEKFEEHGKGWCSPEVMEVDGNKIFVHREEQ